MEKIQKALEKAREARAGMLRVREQDAWAPPPAGGREGAGLSYRREVGTSQSAPRARGNRGLAAGVAKIQQALARNDHQPPPSEREPEPGDPLSAPVKPAAETSANPELRDRHVRVVEVDPEVLERHRVLATGTEGAAADAFRILRTRLLARLEGQQGRAIAICAPGQGDGKTLIAVNLAVAVVRQINRRAVLVDLDLRRPSLHRHFGLSPAAGVSDYLLGQKSLPECLIGLGSERLLLLPQGAPVSASSELLASPRMDLLVRELKAHLPDAMLIYDCPPLLTTDDCLVAMRHADGCLLVVHEGKTRKADLLRAAELVDEDFLLGTVLNNARWSSASSYYYG